MREKLMCEDPRADFELIPDFTIGEPTSAFRDYGPMWTDEETDYLMGTPLNELKWRFLGPLVAVDKSEE